MSWIRRLAGSRAREASKRVEDAESQAYSDWQEYKATLPTSHPSAESDVKIRMLKHLFTLEEARIAAQLSAIPEPLNRIHKRVRKKGMSLEELELILDDLAERGVLLMSTKGGKKYYSNFILPLGMFQLQGRRLNEDFVKDVLDLFASGI